MKDKSKNAARNRREKENGKIYLVKILSFNKMPLSAICIVKYTL